jgi:hypothetical protein
MTSNGAATRRWTLYLHPLFQQQLEKLAAQVETLQAKDPRHYPLWLDFGGILAARSRFLADRHFRNGPPE